MLIDPGENKDYCLFCGEVHALEQLYACYMDVKRKRGHLGNCCEECKAKYLDRPVYKVKTDLAFALHGNLPVLQRNFALLREELTPSQVAKLERRLGKLRRKFKRE